ncbi:MBL fold metallo-hydrolase [Bradyrhizobium sp. DOA1]|uniref:MBL fold metallo-hydrolase n=1 Tax=Bradyrhizobium sp. DOA1 TaxID=1126616 RepID=UPI00077C4488|nr:MBL fold metallo-hydrolase [Bradyrhizobium sp. DOA1]
MDTPFRVTLLGSGMPSPDPLRFGPATLIEAGSQKIMVDAGRGATMRLLQLGIPIGSIDLLLLTHFHSDHVVGLPDIWLTGWLGGKFGRRSLPMRVLGPPGTVHLTHHLEKAFGADIAIRMADEHLPPQGARIDAAEFERDGVIHDREGLRITCFEVDHGDKIKPAFGYRFDYRGKSAVLSGDTRYCENLIAHADRVDLLVHEVAMVRPASMEIERIRRVIGHHSTPADAARVFAKCAPKLAVYNHLVLIDDGESGPPTAQDLIDATRQDYDGAFVVGEDLMAFCP